MKKFYQGVDAQVRKTKLDIEAVMETQKMSKIRDDRVSFAAFLNHKDHCVACKMRYDMYMHSKDAQEAGEETVDLMRRLASETLTPHTVH